MFLCFRRLQVEERGAAQIEHAVLLAIVVILALGGMISLGEACRGALQRVAATTDAGENDWGSMATMAVAVASADVVADGDVAIDAAAHFVAGWLLVGLVVGGGCGVAAWQWRRRRSSRKRPVLEGSTVAATTQRAQARFVAKRQQILKTLSGDLRRLLESDLDVRQLMTDQVATVLPSTPVGELQVKMTKLQVHHLLVCDAEQQLLGVISDRDLKAGCDGVAADVMTCNPLTVGPEQPIKPVVTLMLNQKISSLPVVEDGRLLGILTTTDLVLALQCMMQVLQNLSVRRQLETAAAREQP